MKKMMMSVSVCVGILIAVGMSQAAGNVETGKKLFESPTLGGGTSGRSCLTCHPGGTNLSRRLFGNSQDSAAAIAKKRSKLTAMVNTCIERPLAGKAIDPAGDEMADLVAYMESLVKDKNSAR